jgi:hypothetical protein
MRNLQFQQLQPSGRCSSKQLLMKSDIHPPGKGFLHQLLGVDAKHEASCLVHTAYGKVLVQLNQG